MKLSQKVIYEGGDLKATAGSVPLRNGQKGFVLDKGPDDFVTVKFDAHTFPVMVLAGDLRPA